MGSGCVANRAAPVAAVRAAPVAVARAAPVAVARPVETVVRPLNAGGRRLLADY